MSEPDSEEASSDRRLLWVAVGVGILVGAARLYGIFTENVNWDEFALLERAEHLARTGELRGGGRPGLANLVLAPFAESCRNAVDAVVAARGLWSAFVVGMLVALWLLLRGVLPSTRHRLAAVVTGVGLWCLAPSFLRYSIQVRTDQIAVLGGLWGGVALLHSRKRPGLALLGGAAMAVGFLASQKLVYVAGPVVILVLASHALHDGVRWRREVVRSALFGTGAVLTVVGFELLTSGLRPTPTTLAPVSGQLDTFEYYRQTAGYWWYFWMWPGLLAQSLVVVLLLVVTVDWFQRPRRDGPLVLAAWVTLAAAVVVIAFHAGRFPYFYIVLGLFPACIGALVLPPLLDRLPSPRTRAAILAGLWVPLSLTALIEARAMVRDDSAHQRESLAFVESALPAEARGFSDQAIFSCRHESNPFPTRFGMHVRRDFFGPDSLANTAALLNEFRGRPVSFMIPPIFPDRYPSAIEEFWESHYVRYYRQVHLPGRRIEAGADGVTFEPIAPGRYRWWPDDGASGLRVGDRHLHAGETVELVDDAGTHLALTDSVGGVLALEVAEPPRPDTSQFFTLFLERRERSSF